MYNVHAHSMCQLTVNRCMYFKWSFNVIILCQVLLKFNVHIHTHKHVHVLANVQYLLTISLVCFNNSSLIINNNNSHRSTTTITLHLICNREVTTFSGSSLRTVSATDNAIFNIIFSCSSSSFSSSSPFLMITSQSESIIPSHTL